MANKRKREKYTGGSNRIKEPTAGTTPNQEVLEAVKDYYLSHPDLYNYDGHDNVSTLERSPLVQSVVNRRSLSSWRDAGRQYRDYFRDGQYLGRVTIDEGDIISMELAWK